MEREGQRFSLGRSEHVDIHGGSALPSKRNWTHRPCSDYTLHALSGTSSIESPAAPTEAPPSDGISEAAGKRLMLAIYMGTIAGVLQILALCTRGHWSKTDYDLGESTAGALFGSWVPAVMTCVEINQCVG